MRKDCKEIALEIQKLCNFVGENDRIRVVNSLLSAGSFDMEKRDGYTMYSVSDIQYSRLNEILRTLKKTLKKENPEFYKQCYGKKQ